MNAYKKLSTEFYELDKPSAPPDAFDFYLHHAKRAVGPILEPMCGTGRFLLPLLAQGFDIEGVDLSRDMLGACRARAQAMGLLPVLHEQSLANLKLGRQFGLAFIPSGSICLLTDEVEVEACLLGLHAAMLPGATLVLEVERLLPREAETSGTWGGRWIERPDGARLIISWLSQYSSVQGISRSIHRYELIKDGQLVSSEYEDFELKFYEPQQFQNLLERAGFSEIRVHKAFAHAPPDDSDEGLVFECRKR